MRRIGDLTKPISSWTPQSDQDGADFTYVDLGSIDQDLKEIVGPRRLPTADAPSRARQIIHEDDVLVSTVRPNLNGVARVSGNLDEATASTGFSVLRPTDELVSAYLFHWVRSPEFVADMSLKSTGQSYPAVSDRIIKNSLIPVPSVREQQRIASALDAVDSLRVKRRKAIALLDELAQSIFLDMFGDPLQNPFDWPEVRFGDLLESSPQNGLSPSKAGSVEAKVLTLSAITGDRFDSNSWKTSTFKVVPPPAKSVRSSGFLVCRGNGNINLVGRGYFPVFDMPEVTFPDTMFSVSPSRRLMREYLQFIWSSKLVRNQIESLSRTTNGTFKINQQALTSVMVLVPPVDLQREFDKKVIAVNQVRRQYEAHLAELDALFASLQYRAFRGELWAEEIAPVA